MQDLLASLDSPAGLAVLAALAFGDTLIGVGFFVFGELAFLAAGGALTASGAYLPALVVLLAAWAGDVASYTIGARYGTRISPLFLKRLKRRRVWRRAKIEMERRGAGFVVLSRFLGPVAWVTPFLAGTLGMPRRVFLGAAALGVLLGVGQFLIYGAIGAQAVNAFLPFVRDHLTVFALLLGMLLSSLYVWRRSERVLWVKSLQAATTAVSVFLASKLLFFFVLSSQPEPLAPRSTSNAVCEATRGPITVDPGQTDLNLPQPLNALFLPIYQARI